MMNNQSNKNNNKQQKLKSGFTSVGFRNFKKFEEFEPLALGDITILVGKNNAGKSTLVKAMLLLLDNVRNLQVRNISENKIFSSGFSHPIFSFSSDVLQNDLHNVKVGTFKRALNFNAEIPEMEFSGELEGFEVSLTIVPEDDNQDKSTATVAKIIVNDKKRMMNFVFDFVKETMRVEFESIKKNENLKLQKIEAALAELRSVMDHEEDPIEIAIHNQHLDNLMKIRQRLLSEDTQEREKTYVETKLEDYLTRFPFELKTRSKIGHYIENMAYYPDYITPDDVFMPIGLSEDEKEEPLRDEEYVDEKGWHHRPNKNWSETEEANQQLLADKKSLIFECAEDFDRVAAWSDIRYIQAHAVSQKVLYSIDDKNDYMAKSIHAFMRESILPGYRADLFIKNWMKAFEIGLDYRITPTGGEAYTFEIEVKSDKWVYLVDLGMGVNQLMILLLNLAVIVNEKREGATHKPTIVIEEPEQNIHPMLQSRLADLFNQLNKDFGYKFLVETHSEYLIRRTQVLVSEKKFQSQEEVDQENPFKVYYFPDDDRKPYSMIYRCDGKFSNEFGNGFFDEATNLAFELF